MFCRKCGKEIVDGSVYCSFCGAEQAPEEEQAEVYQAEKTEPPSADSAEEPSSAPRQRRLGKWLIAIVSVFVVASIICVIVWRQSTAWTRDLTLTYIDHVVSDEYGHFIDNSYEIYEITNNTSHTLHNVVAVIEVTNGLWGDEKWKIEKNIESEINPGETVEFRLYFSYIKESAEERDTELFMSNNEIVKIKYN